MHPDLITINFWFIKDFSIAWYGVLITLGVVLGAVIGMRYAERRGLDTNLFSDMILYSVIWGVIGARVFYVMTSLDEFRGASFLDIINIRRGGISIHGGLLFGIGALLYYQWRYRINIYRYADLMVPGVALGIIGGRLGNFFNGSDTVGRLTNWPIGFTWPDKGSSILGIFNSEKNWSGFPGLCYKPGEFTTLSECGDLTLRGPVHLTQIYGAIIGLILVVAAFYWLRSKRPGWVFWQFWLWYSVLRSIEELFRLNPLIWKIYLSEGPDKPGIGLLTLTQLVSIPIVIAAIIMLGKIRRLPEESVAVPASIPTPELVANAKKDA